MKSLVTVVATAAALLALGVRPATGCSCVSSGPACQAFWNATAVFDATVVRIDPIPTEATNVGNRDVQISEKRVRLAINAAWKGVDAGEIDVVTNADGASCGFDFKVGRRYLVFSSELAIGGYIRVSLCSATREFDGTGEAAAFFSSLTQPPKGGRVYGSIKLNQGTVGADGRPVDQSPMDLTLLINGGGTPRSTTTKGGQYEFAALAAGHYEVEIVLPPGYSTWRTRMAVDIPDGRACFEQDFYVTPAGRIGGRLTSRDGRGLANVTVEAASPESLTTGDYYYPQLVSTRTETDGHFEFTNLSPGKYVIGLNLRDLPNQWQPYPRLLFPGGDAPPQIIELALGQAVELGAWQTPPPLAIVPLTGLITWRDGTPAVGVFVSISDVTGNPIDKARGAGGATVDRDGRFVVEGREGRDYRFVARPPNNGPFLPLNAVRITARPGVEPVHLVIQRDPPGKELR